MKDNKYSFNSRVRYSETDFKGNLSMSGIMNYIQDCSTYQSESLGLGIDHLKSVNRAWLVVAWNIVIERQISLGTNIKISTWAEKFKTIYGSRNFTISDDEDNICVKANSLWVHINTENRHPVKAEESEMTPYGEGETLDIETAVRKYNAPEKCVECESFKVKKHYLDSNGHVNNAWYITWAEEYLDSDFEVKEIKVFYQKEAVYGDMILPGISKEDDKVTVLFNSEDKHLHAAVEFIRK